MELIIGRDHMQDVSDVTAEYPYALHPLVSSAETRVPWHWHEEVEFSLVRRGALQVTVAGRRQVLETGEGMFLNTNVLHAMGPANPDVETVWDCRGAAPPGASGRALQERLRHQVSLPGAEEQAL